MADAPRNSGFGVRNSGFAGSREHGPDSIDLVIDAVARDMTRVDAPPSMRASVLARIERQGGESGSGWPRAAWAAGFAVAVLVITAAVWFATPGRQPGVGADSMMATRGAAPVPAGRAAAPPPHPSTKVVPSGLVAGNATGGGAGAATSHNLGATAGRTVPPAPGNPGPAATAAPDAGPDALSGPTPIVIVDIEPAAVRVPEIGVAPIGELKPITIQDIPGGPGPVQTPSDARIESQRRNQP